MTDFTILGLMDRYIIKKRDMSPVHPQAEYFVLRLDDHGRDPIHIEACKKAVLLYARLIKNHLPLLAADLISKYGEPTLFSDVPFDFDEYFDLELPEACAKMEKPQIYRELMRYRDPIVVPDGNNLGVLTIKVLDGYDKYVPEALRGHSEINILKGVQDAVELTNVRRAQITAALETALLDKLLTERLEKNGVQ